MSKLKNNFDLPCHSKTLDQRRRIICLHDKLIPQLVEHLRFKGKQIFHHFNGISTQMLTCALSLLKDRKIYERNIEFVRKLLVLLAIYMSHMRAEKEAEHFVFNICESVLTRIGEKSPHVQHTVVHMSMIVFHPISLRTI